MKIPEIYNNKRLCHSHAEDTWLPRCYWSKAKKKQSTSILIKCGCCDEKFKFYLPGTEDDLIEIGGVVTTICWLKGLLEFIDKYKKEVNRGKGTAGRVV